MKVSLDSRGGGSTHFAIMPRYKIRSVGDIVKVGDEIVFESIKSESQFLSASTDVLPSAEEPDSAVRSLYPIPNCHEVSLSVNQSSFEIDIYTRPSGHSMRQYGATMERQLAPAPSITKNFEDTSIETDLQTGMVIQLFHKDSSAYVSAEGSIENSFDGVRNKPHLDVHLRCRGSDPERPSRLFAPTSAVTYFVVELAEGPHAGGTISWDSVVRLKHVPTQLYISAANPEAIGAGFDDADLLNMSLMSLAEIEAATTAAGDPSAFELHSEIAASKTVPVDAFLRLRHQMSQFWVHAGTTNDSHHKVIRPTRNESSASRAGGAFADSITKLTWDKAPLFQFSLTRNKETPDAFSICKVPDELVYYVNTIAGYIPMLQRYVAIRKLRELRPPEAECLAKELNELDSFMYSRGLEQKKRQKLLRSLQVIEALIAMLKVPFLTEQKNVASPGQRRDSQYVGFGNGDSLDLDDLDDDGDDLDGDNFVGGGDDAHMLANYDDVTRKENRNTQIVMVNCFRVLRSFLCGNARKNEMYMASHVPFLWRLFGTNMKVEPMFNELVLDNIQIVKTFGLPEIQKVVAFLRKDDRNADYLQLFSALCVCEGEPNRFHQQLIGRELLDNANPPVILTDVKALPSAKGQLGSVRTKAGGFVKKTVIVRENDQDAGVEMNKFVASALDEDDQTSTPDYLFLQRQLELYGNLCLGRMEANIKLIVKTHKHLTWDECFLCATANSALSMKNGKVTRKTMFASPMMLPRSLRLIYVNLIVNLFIDVGDNRDVCTDAELSYNYAELRRDYYVEAAKHQIRALSGAEFKHFEVVKKWIHVQLENVTSMIHKDKFVGRAKNLMLASILNLLQTLIRFGYYIDEQDVVGVMKPLKGVLSGLNDLEKPLDEQTAKPDELKALNRWRASKRYEMDEDGLAVMDAKLKALACIGALFNFVFNVRLRFLLSDYKSLTDPEVRDNVKRKSSSAALLQLLAIRERGIQLAGGLERLDLSQFLGEAHGAIAKTRDGVSGYLKDITDECDFVTAGWDVNMPYTHIDQHGEPTLVAVLLDTARYEYYPLLTQSLQLVDKIYSAEADLTQCAIDANIAYTKDSVVLAKQLDLDTSILTRESRGVLAEGGGGNVIKLLKYYTAMCYIKSADIDPKRSSATLNLVDPGTNHFMNQQNSFNSGMLTIVLNIISTPEQPGDVLAAAFDCARAHACGYPDVQHKLFESLDIILGVHSKSTSRGTLGTWQQSMGLCLAEVFDGCKETCLGVRPGQVASMLALLVKYNSNAPSFVDALEAVAKVEEFNLPLPRNQGLIIKSLMQHKDAVMVQAFIDDKSDAAVNAQRLACLEPHNGDEAAKKAQTYHLALVNLLGSICEGENQQIEATCRSIFSLDELTQSITSTTIPHANKAPYMKFLLWVYLNAAASKTAIGTDVIDTDIKIFQAFAEIGGQELTTYYTSGGAVKVEHALFAFDAYLPCLEKLIDRHASVVHKAQIEMIARHVTTFIGNLKKNPSAHMHKFRTFAFVRCMEALGKYLENQKIAKPPGFDSGKSWVAQQGIHLDAGVSTDSSLADYHQKYAKEKRLNDELNIFSSMIFKAYKGVNSIKDQLHLSSTGGTLLGLLGRHENTNLAYSEKEGDDQEIPLGSEFQRFLTIFDDTEAKHALYTHLNPDVVNLCVRLFADSRAYQATVSSEAREDNDRIVTKLLQALRAKCHNDEMLRGSTTQLQKQIVEADAILAITGLISSNQRKLRQEALSMIVAILNNGYGEAQKSFTMYFLGTREEAFFADITGLIKISSDSILELRALRLQKSIADQKQAELRKTMTMTLNGQHQMAKMVAADHGRESDRPEVLPENHADALAFSDPGNIRLVLNTLQTMCEGHNSILQDYLREQPDNVTQFNLVAQVSRFMERIRVDAAAGDELSKEILMQTLDCLTELAQGNAPNQKEIFDARVTDSINAMIRETLIEQDFGFDHAYVGEPDEHVDRRMEWNADAKCAQLMLAQLATNDEVSRYLAKELTKVLDIGGILQKIRYYRTVSLSETEKKALAAEDGGIACWEPATVAYTYFSVIKRLTDFTGKEYHTDSAILKSDRRQLASYKTVNHKNSGKSGKGLGLGFGKGGNKTAIAPLDKVYLELDESSESIEIVMNGQLQKVHFNVPEEWKHQLQEEVKNRLLWSIDRSSTNDGVRDFSERCKTIIADMKYMESMMGFSWVTATLVKAKGTLHSLVLMLTFLLNLMILAFWDSDLNDRVTVKPTHHGLTDEAYEAIFEVLAILHSAVAVLIVLVYFLTYPPSLRALVDDVFHIVYGAEALEKRNHNKAMVFLLGKSEEEVVKADEDDDDVGAGNAEDENEVVVDDRQQRVFQTQENIGYLQENELIPRTLYRTQTSVLSGMSLYYLIFLGMSILGHYTYGYTFCFHLLHITVGNQTLSRVIQSVTKNGVTLLYVAGLLMVIIYIYTLVVFATMRLEMDRDEGLFCTNMLECFLTSVKLGLLSGGGLGEAIPPHLHEYTGIWWVVGRFTFDLSFFILVTLIGLNVVFGIIVDTFSELRDEKYQIQEAMDTECFICGRSSNDLDRRSTTGNFKHHVKHEHRMWNYLFFYYYLDKKDATEYDDIEQYIAEKMFTGMYDFYPIGKALGLEKADALEAGDDNQIEELVSQVAGLNRIQEEILARLTAIDACVHKSAEASATDGEGRARTLSSTQSSV
jgi:inositol 1,4,5-triphosphate receptor type 1